MSPRKPLPWVTPQVPGSGSVGTKLSGASATGSILRRWCPAQRLQRLDGVRVEFHQGRRVRVHAVGNQLEEHGRLPPAVEFHADRFGDVLHGMAVDLHDVAGGAPVDLDVMLAHARTRLIGRLSLPGYGSV